MTIDNIFYGALIVVSIILWVLVFRTPHKHRPLGGKVPDMPARPDPPPRMPPKPSWGKQCPKHIIAEAYSRTCAITCPAISAIHLELSDCTLLDGYNDCQNFVPQTNKCTSFVCTKIVRFRKDPP